MSNVLLATDSGALQQRVHQASGNSSITLPSSDLPEDLATLLALTGHSSLPDVIVLDATADAEAALALAARVDRDLPGTGVVLIGDPTSLALAALRVGARDVLPPDADTTELKETFDRVVALAEQRRIQLAAAVPAPLTHAAPGRVLTVLSPKGGAGKTTVATNLAVGLAQNAPGAVVLVDLDVQFGDVATVLGLDPDFTLEDVVGSAALKDPIALKTHLTLHSSGLAVICAPQSPVVADSIATEQVSSLITTLATQFRFVVIDTAAGLEARTLAALDHTTDPLLLTTFDVIGARGLRKEMATLRELGMLSSTRQVLLNFADPRSGLNVSDVEATIRSRVDATLPHSKAVTASLNAGTPLLLQSPKDPVAKKLRQLVTSYVQVGSAPRTPERAFK